MSHNIPGVVNDLITINIDRLSGYEKAIREAGEKNVDIKAIFSAMADESRRNISELSTEVKKLGKEPAVSGTVNGKIYQALTSLKNGLFGGARLALLASCEVLERKTEKAYRQALDLNETLPPSIRQLVTEQSMSLKKSGDTIQRFKNMHKVSDSDDIIVANMLRSSNGDLRDETYLPGTRN